MSESPNDGASSTSEPDPSQAWHALEIEATLERVGSSTSGLETSEAAERLERFGGNRLRPPKRHSAWFRLLLQFHNILIYLLLLAAAATAFLEHWIDTGVILAVVVVNALIGFIQEGKAERALEAITRMLSLEATVIRDGRRQTVAAEALVPGDLVLLHVGDKVPADMRLVKARELRIDEALLTGESVPAEKSTESLPAETVLGDRSCIAYSGTLVTTGNGAGVVVATGEGTELGKISEMVSQTEAIVTPLIAQMNRFGHVLAVVITVFALLTFAAGYFVGHGDPVELFMAAVALAVATIPEGLPAIMTIVLAIGVERMARRSAIIRRLPAVDTLGALTVICSDKTGTLTRNEMTVTSVGMADSLYEVTGVGYGPIGELRRDGKPVRVDDVPALMKAVRAGLLCNDSDLRRDGDRWLAAGDPMEGALITLAIKASIDIEAVRERCPAVDTIPFDSKHRFMATLHRDPSDRNRGDGGGESGVVYLKGGPERVLAMCDRQSGGEQTELIDTEFWERQMAEFASQGRRVLAVAWKPATAGQDRLSMDDMGSGFVMLGLLGIIDPPREEAIVAVRQCHEAGIRVVMITGDHGMTARAIGSGLGIGDGEKVLTGEEIDDLGDDALGHAVADCAVFARVNPEHKLRLVTTIQSGGEVVAMTGDGVNDAPALKRADVGVAMGIKGTEVTKEAAEMVLTDDNFASIAHAVEEGRTVYDNIRKAILFILPTNGGEGLTIFLAIVLGRSLPLTPVQVLWVNMITAVTLALALAFEAPEADVMKRPPRDPKSNLLSRYFLFRIALVSAVMCAGTFGMFVWVRSWGESEAVARTIAVNTIVMFEVFYLFNARFIVAPVLSFNGLLGSRPVLLAVTLVIGFQMLFTYVPLMQRLFDTTAIGVREWGLILAVSSAVLWIVELEKWITRRISRSG